MKNTCVVIENDVNISKLCVENEEETRNERIDHSTKKEGHNDGGNNIKVINAKTGNLIVDEKNINAKHMGNLGKWISTTRIGSGVTNETRSQSLPDCYVKKVRSDEKECCDALKTNSPIKLEHISNQDACFWFNTWPEKIPKSLDAEQKNDKNVTSRGYCDVMKQQNNIEKKCAHVNSCKCLTLNEALESFQLAYNPVTKQLQYSQKKNVINNDNCKNAINNVSINDNNSERVKQQQCDVEETVSCSVTNIKGDVKTLGHRRTLDAGSFSSTVSSLSDASPSGSLLGSEERSVSSGDEFGGNKTKKKGISAFFSSECMSLSMPITKVERNLSQLNSTIN